MDVNVKDLVEMMFKAESNLCEIDGKDASAYHLAFMALLEIFTERLDEREKELAAIREKWVNTSAE